MSFLMKSCEAHHHINEAENIRIGTLASFRENPDPEVGDDLEAALATRVEVRTPRVFPSQILNAILPYGMVYYEANNLLRREHRFVLHSYNIGEVANGQVHIENFDFEYVTEGSDALIFCMTVVRNRASDARLGYNSSWKMRRSSAARFGNKLLAELNRKFRAEPDYFLGEDCEANGFQPNEMNFVLRHAPVKYRPKHVHLVDPSLAELVELGYLLKNSDMVKAECYANQDEYRFCFRLVHNEKLVKLRSDLKHVDVDATSFRRYSL